MDYKHRFPDNRYRIEEKKSRSVLWVLIGLLVVLLAVAVGWAVTHRQEMPKEAAQDQTQTPAAKPETNPVALPDKPVDAKTGAKKPAKPVNPKLAQEAATVENKPPEPRFTFYKILPEKEAIIPESEIKNLKNEESLSKKPQGGQYLLQAGSFTNPLDAVKLKEKLTALKIKAHIENVKIENTAWNRVKIGPFKSLADADKVRTYLRNNQLDSVVQKAVTKPATQTPAKH